MRIAIVVVRYGAEIVGGAESQARGFAEAAARRGWEVEVWTTCARSHYTWENEFPPGSHREGNVIVRRFPVAKLNLERQGQIEGRLGTQGHLPVAAQYAWLGGGAHSILLYEYVAGQAEKFDAVVVLPYANPMMNMAAWAWPDNVVMWPCLHDEPYAYMEPIRLLLESVRGVMFNSPEERDLAVKRLGMELRHEAVLGEGVTLEEYDKLPESNGNGHSPRDLLYLGRLEGGKNLALLYEYVQRYVEDGGDLRLVVYGGGPFVPPAHPAFDYCGYVADAAKTSAYASALALCQPSLNESFSLTVMESWLAGRPALVHADCAVTRGHVERSHGGLWFRTYDEFVGAIEWLGEHPDLAARMGRNGRRYVEENYTWDAVADRFERILSQWGRDE
jgi:glycosyltransferase involved in cell wall biosynthesis